MMDNTVTQKVHHVSPEEGKVFLESRLGTVYPVDMNHYIKSLEPGDTVVIETGTWKILDIQQQTVSMIDITEFPRTETGDLNHIAYMEYLQAISDMTESDRIRFDEYLIKKYNINRGIHQ